MDSLLFVILFVLIIVIFTKLRKLETEIQDAKQRLLKIEKLQGVTGTEPAMRLPVEQSIAAAKEPVPAKKEMARTGNEKMVHDERPTSVLKTPPPQSESFFTILAMNETVQDIKPKENEKPEAASSGNELWKRLERRFIENWTGIIGAAVTVMGVSFIGIYAALAMKPLYRFLT